MSGTPENALAAPGFAPLQREWLAVLGVIALQRRAAFLPEAGVAEVVAPDAVFAQVETQAPQVPTRAAPRLRVLAEGLATPFTSADAKLLRAILAAIGLSEGDIADDADSTLPLLAFGRSEEPATFRLRALPQLRNPIEKRVAWKELRRVKRSLQDAAQ